MHPLAKISRKLSKKLAPMTFAAPVTHVYDPLTYARAPHEAYLERYGDGPKEAIFLGMNPGPFGMAQTGVPFGEIAHVRDWLEIEGKVGKPPKEHPKREIVGFECTRSEVSGRRLWGWAKERFETPDAFFARFFVANYCPLVFMEGDNGKNRVPEKLPKAEREPLLAACDASLRELVKALEPKWLIGVGKWPRVRAEKALEGIDIKIGNVLHPSPANPHANKDWAGKAQKQLEELGIEF
ncbi:MAG: uracil-DNA glycosylase family protein [Myxococcota bacterium]